MLQRHVEELEKVDEMYLRSLLDAHTNTAIEALYIETGKMPIRFLIQKRRLMYWHHVNNASKDSLLRKFYQAQKNQPVKGDWITLIEKDKNDFNISYKDEELAKISKRVFKKLVKKEANKLALKYLKNLKLKHSLK